MKRSAPPKRYTPLKRKRSKPRRSSRVRDKAYLEFIRRESCCAYLVQVPSLSVHIHSECEGRVHAHHAGARGYGQKASDRTCIPLCMRHHRAFHDLGWPFIVMQREERLAWVMGQIGYYQEMYERRAVA